MAKKRQKALTDTEVEIARVAYRSNTIVKVSQAAAKYGSLSFAFYMVYKSIAALAGSSTFADINIEAGVRWLLSTETTEVLSLLIGIGGLLYGRQQAKLRRDVVERMHPDQVDRELALNPGRTSSNLTTRGETRPGDL